MISKTTLKKDMVYSISKLHLKVWIFSFPWIGNCNSVFKSRKSVSWCVSHAMDVRNVNVGTWQWTWRGNTFCAIRQNFKSKSSVKALLGFALQEGINLRVRSEYVQRHYGTTVLTTTSTTKTDGNTEEQRSKRLPYLQTHDGRMHERTIAREIEDKPGAGNEKRRTTQRCGGACH